MPNHQHSNRALELRLRNMAPRMYGHGYNHAARRCDQGNCTQSIVIHAWTVTSKLAAVNVVSYHAARYRTPRLRMSGKSPPTRKLDRRVRRTRNALGDALIALIEERSFQDITVQDILDRAQISRSTFYAHYRDKDDLFLSDVEDFLELMSNLLLRQNEASNRIVPVRELLTHFAQMRPLLSAFTEADKLRDFLELGHGYF